MARSGGGCAGVTAAAARRSARGRSLARRTPQRFDDELRRRRRLGDLGIVDRRREETLNEYVTETWAPTHAVTLSPRTAKTYAALYDMHIAPYLGHLKLVELTPEVDRSLAGGADRGGRWAHVSVLKALQLLGTILQRARGVGADRAQPGAAGAQGAAAAEAEVRPLRAGDRRGDARGERPPRRDADLGAGLRGAAAAGGARTELAATSASGR